MNPSILTRNEEQDQAGPNRAPDLEHDRFIAIVGAVFTGVKTPHRILVPNLTNAVYGKIPDDPQVPEEPVPLHGNVICGTRDEIIAFQTQSTLDTLQHFASRQELWESNAIFQQDLKNKGLQSFALGFDSRIAVTEDDRKLNQRPNRQHRPGAKLAPADVEFIRKVFAAAFPNRSFTPLQMAEALLIYHNDQTQTAALTIPFTGA